MGLGDQLRIAATQITAEKNAAEAANERYFQPIAEQVARLGLCIRHALGNQGFNGDTQATLDFKPFNEESAAVLNGAEDWDHKTPSVYASLRIRGMTHIGSREINFRTYFRLSEKGAPLETIIEARIPDPEFSKCHGDTDKRIKQNHFVPHSTETLFPELPDALRFFFAKDELDRLVLNTQALEESELMAQTVQQVVADASRSYAGLKIAVPEIEGSNETIDVNDTDYSKTLILTTPAAT